MLLRNPEIKKMLGIYLIFSIVAIIAAAFIDYYAAAYVAGVCVISALFFMYHTAKRYRSIANLTDQLDRILHSTAIIHFAPDKEGELAVLADEISKIIIRLQEQSELLNREKMYLANSMADISHQIRTPLTSVRMILPRLRREDVSTHQKEEYLQEISSLLTRLEWLIDALLKIARLESGTVLFHKAEFMITDLINKALEPLVIFMEIKEIAVQTDISPDSTISGDFLWCAEAIGNILKNCVEHIPDQETLMIKASDNPIYTEIVIADTGPGIAPEDLPHLFERFYKGKFSNLQNAGIGLALSHTIIIRQNGTVTASNRTPHGAEFHIRFYKNVT